MKPNLATNAQPDEDARWEAVEEATEQLMERNPREALYLLREVVRNDPRNPYAYYYIGTALFEIGRFDAAADAYEAALRLSPRYIAARVGLSHAVRIGGEPTLAIHHANLALEQCPGDGDALFALGLALSTNKDRVGAVRALRAFLATHPELEVTIEAQAMLEKLGLIEGDADFEESDDSGTSSAID